MKIKLLGYFIIGVTVLVFCWTLWQLISMQIIFNEITTINHFRLVEIETYLGLEK